ncbi:MAG: AAA family ATPase [Microscillaceae bacterium]|nr:AAA family ATPase [Microscillaceae bacterium]
MIQEIRIQNFKSIQKLKIPLGRFNVLIGENGSGKSNLLEAVAMGAAAAANKLDNEFLASRGIRVIEPPLMRSAFEKENLERDVEISFLCDETPFNYVLKHNNISYSGWEKSKRIDKFVLLAALSPIKSDIEAFTENLNQNSFTEVIKNISQKMKNVNFENSDNFDIVKWLSEANESAAQYFGIDKFLIYSPENSILRRFEDETQIEPLGIQGEGLFKLITIIAREKPEQFAKIKAALKLIDWFQDFDIPRDLVFTEKRLQIKDRYLDPDLQYFSQRSANEGFLFLLFYITLFVSDYTPTFFAIDNIDNALNPKLCQKLTSVLARLAKEHNKQVIVTTHNPAILDGLDLNDEEQRLFVVRRNADGHTKLKRIRPIPTPEGKNPIRLSEAFLNGFIGGLPKNF